MPQPQKLYVEDPDDEFPRVPEDLLLALEKRFRDRLPDVSTPDRKIWISVGNSEVVRFLRDMHERPPQL